MQLDKAIESRRSIKEFTDKKPDWRDIIECIDSARFAPMAGNNFSLKFIIVDDEEVIKKLAQFSEQEFISQTKYVVVVCSDSKRTKILYGDRGEIYARQQAGSAIQNFLLKLTDKNLATCWIGHFLDEKVKKELNIPKEINVEAMFPVGYEKGETKKPSKIDLDSILYFKTYGNKKMKLPKKF